jgi:hypothetical protein
VQLKESVIIADYKTGDRNECNNYRDISLLSTSYDILSKTLLSRLSPYVNRIIGVINVGFKSVGWRKLHNEELHNLYCSPYIIVIINSKRMG